MKTITYDDTLYQLVPKEPTQEQWGELARDIMMWLRWDQPTPAKLFKHLEMLGRDIPQWLRDEPEMKNLDHVVSKGTCCVLIYHAMLSSAPAPPAHPEAQSNEWTLIAPDGARFSGPTPGKTAIEAGKHHMETDPEAREKFLRAIKQIAEEGRQEREQCMRDYGTLECPHCGGSGHIADAVANGFPPPAQPVKQLTEKEIEAGRGEVFSINNPFCPCDSKTFRKAVKWAEAAHGITAQNPHEPGA